MSDRLLRLTLLVDRRRFLRQSLVAIFGAVAAATVGKVAVFADLCCSGPFGTGNCGSDCCAGSACGSCGATSCSYWYGVWSGACWHSDSCGGTCCDCYCCAGPFGCGYCYCWG